MGAAITGQCCAHDGVLETQVVSVPAANNGYGKPVFSDLDLLLRQHWLVGPDALPNQASEAAEWQRRLQVPRDCAIEPQNMLEDALVFSEGRAGTIASESFLPAIRGAPPLTVSKASPPTRPNLVVLSSEGWNSAAFVEELNMHAQGFSLHISPLSAPCIFLGPMQLPNVR
mmetsp:Transcript_63834/g.152246  ORF Transcript_63834/g.152246 Transcript_63834/m.152246 type:complete len:171 (-) Transcript_63834:113-625(-)